MPQNFQLEQRVMIVAPSSIGNNRLNGVNSALGMRLDNRTIGRFSAKGVNETADITK